MSENKRIFLKSLPVLILVLLVITLVLYPRQPTTVDSTKHTETETVLGCNSFSGTVRDNCLYTLSREIHSKNASLQEVTDLCMQITDTQMRGYCKIQASLFELEQRKLKSMKGVEINDSYELTTEICNSIPEEEMRDECYFKSAESIARIRTGGFILIEEALAACNQSKRFKYDCIGHLVGRGFIRNHTLTWRFCKRIKEEYENISTKPITYCFTHYGQLLRGYAVKNNVSPCDFIDVCISEPDYSKKCLHGLFDRYPDMDVICGCPNIVYEGPNKPIYVRYCSNVSG
jgi:hypothetical protein